MPSKSPLLRLYDIRDNARLAQQWTARHTCETFEADELTVYAVTRSLEIVSEASRRIPQGSVAETGCLWPAAVFKFNAHSGRGRGDGFQWRHFAGDIVLHGVRWYCKYGISYRDLKEMMEARGIAVDHTTLYRWVQKYAPEIEKRLRWHRRGHEFQGSWRVDETYVKVKGEWKYLYRAVSAQGATIDFYLSNTRNIGAATIFLKKALRATAASHPPESITTDKNPTYQTAITRINEARVQERPIKHRDVKYLNNVIEADHGKLKRLIKPTLGFKSMKTAYATLKGFEGMRMFRKGQFAGWYPGEGVRGEVRLINRQFGIYGA